MSHSRGRAWFKRGRVPAQKCAVGGSGMWTIIGGGQSVDLPALKPYSAARENHHPQSSACFAARYTWSLSAFIWACSASLSAAEDFKLTIHRQYSDANCTSGYLAVNGTIQAYTLERPWLGNAPLISSIPSGTYPGILRYDHSDQWRIELTGVPNRDHIEVHTGNTPDDTEGCIIIGKELGDDLCSIKAGTSQPAYRDLKNAFYGSPNPVSTPDKTITVVVEGMTP